MRINSKIKGKHIMRIFMQLCLYTFFTFSFPSENSVNEREKFIIEIYKLRNKKRFFPIKKRIIVYSFKTQHLIGTFSFIGFIFPLVKSKAELK